MKLVVTRKKLMISAAAVSSLRVLRTRPTGSLRVVAGVAAHERHHRDAGLEARDARGPAAGTPGAPRPPSASGLP